MSANSAYVIKIGNRFFCKFGKGNRVMTAWCLAGSKLFQVGNDADPHYFLAETKMKLNSLGKKYEVVTVGRLC